MHTVPPYASGRCATAAHDRCATRLTSSPPAPWHTLQAVHRHHHARYTPTTSPHATSTGSEFINVQAPTIPDTKYFGWAAEQGIQAPSLELVRRGLQHDRSTLSSRLCFLAVYAACEQPDQSRRTTSSSACPVAWRWSSPRRCHAPVQTCSTRPTGSVHLGASSHTHTTLCAHGCHHITGLSRWPSLCCLNADVVQHRRSLATCSTCQPLSTSPWFGPMPTLRNSNTPH